MPNYFDIPQIPRLSPPPAVRPPDWGRGISLKFNPGTFNAARRLQAGISYRPEDDQGSGEIQDENSNLPAHNPSPDAPLDRVRGDSPRAQQKSEEERLRSRADKLALAGVFGNAGDTIARGFMTMGGVKQGVPTGNERSLQGVENLRQETLGDADRARVDARDRIPPAVGEKLSKITGGPIPETYTQLGKLNPILVGVARIEAEKLRAQESERFQMGQQERSQGFQRDEQASAQGFQENQQARSQGFQRDEQSRMLEAEGARQDKGIAAAGARATAASSQRESDKAEETKKRFIEENSHIATSDPEIRQHRAALSQITNAMSELSGPRINPAQFQKAATLLATASQAGGTRSLAMSEALEKQPGLIENLKAWASQKLLNEPSEGQVKNLREAARSLERGTKENQSRLIEDTVILRYQAAKDLGVPFKLEDIHRQFTGE